VEGWRPVISKHGLHHVSALKGRCAKCLLEQLADQLHRAADDESTRLLQIDLFIFTIAMLHIAVSVGLPGW
jgi:hypothetical protein